MDFAYFDDTPDCGISLLHTWKPGFEDLTDGQEWTHKEDASHDIIWARSKTISWVL